MRFESLHTASGLPGLYGKVAAQEDVVREHTAPPNEDI